MYFIDFCDIINVSLWKGWRCQMNPKKLPFDFLLVHDHKDTRIKLPHRLVFYVTYDKEHDSFIINYGSINKKKRRANRMRYVPREVLNDGSYLYLSDVVAGLMMNVDTTHKPVLVVDAGAREILESHIMQP